MKAYNHNGYIRFEGTYWEVASIVTVLDDYLALNPDDETIREIVETLHNPEVVY